MSVSYDFIIIGAGLTGMQCGALLAHKGARVLLLDKNPYLGGRGQVVQRDGFTLDYGFHFARFGSKGPIATIASRLGQPLEFVDLEDYHLFKEDGSCLLFPTGPRQLFRTRLLTVPEKLRALRLLLHARGASSFDHLQGKTVRQWMDEEKLSANLRTYLTCASINLILCPFVDRASAAELLGNLGMTVRAGKSAAYPTHGWEHVYQGLVRRIGEKGEVRLGKAVQKIQIEAGTARGVVTDGQTLSARHVVFCAPVQALPHLVEGLEPAFAQRAKGVKPSAGIVLDLALSRRVSNHRGLDYFVNPIAFGYFPSNLCPKLTPEGHQLASFFIPAEREDVQDPERCAALLDKLRQQISLAYPEMLPNVLWERVLPLPFAFGAELVAGQERSARLEYAVPGIRNLFVLGDSTRGGAAGGDIGHISVLEFMDWLDRQGGWRAPHGQA
jgi:phytoene dehydrogenase-like protein